MITVQSIVKDYVTNVPEARERSNKDRAIANMVFKELLPKLVKKTLTYDRAWRKVLKDNPELQGSDYNDKEELEDYALEELGYK